MEPSAAQQVVVDQPADDVGAVLDMGYRDVLVVGVLEVFSPGPEAAD